MKDEKKLNYLKRIVRRILFSGYSRTFVNEEDVKNWMVYILGGGARPVLPNTNKIARRFLLAFNPHIVYWEKYLSPDAYIRLKDLYDFIYERRIALKKG